MQYLELFLRLIGLRRPTKDLRKMWGYNMMIDKAEKMLKINLDSDEDFLEMEQFMTFMAEVKQKNRHIKLFDRKTSEFIGEVNFNDLKDQNAVLSWLVLVQIAAFIGRSQHYRVVLGKELETKGLYLIRPQDDIGRKLVGLFERTKKHDYLSIPTIEHRNSQAIEGSGDRHRYSKG